MQPPVINSSTRAVTLQRGLLFSELKSPLGKQTRFSLVWTAEGLFVCSIGRLHPADSGYWVWSKVCVCFCIPFAEVCAVFGVYLCIIKALL